MGLWHPGVEYEILYCLAFKYALWFGCMLLWTILFYFPLLFFFWVGGFTLVGWMWEVNHLGDCSRPIDFMGHQIASGLAEHMPFSPERRLSFSQINSRYYPTPPMAINSEPTILSPRRSDGKHLCSFQCNYSILMWDGTPGHNLTSPSKSSQMLSMRHDGAIAKELAELPVS